LSSPVRQLIDERRAELMVRLEQLEHVRAAGEGVATRALEIGLLERLRQPGRSATRGIPAAAGVAAWIGALCDACAYRMRDRSARS
jgi:hypothetical protein